MNEQKTALITIAVIAIIAMSGIVLMLNSQPQGAVTVTNAKATYHQLIHRNKEVYLPYYNVCARGPCGAEARQIGEVQSEENPATRTAVCTCPDGRTFQTDYRAMY